MEHGSKIVTSHKQLPQHICCTKRTRQSNFKLFAPGNAEEQAEPVWANSAHASQKTENTAPGKERKLHGHVLGKDINHKVAGETGDGKSNFIILEMNTDGGKTRQN